MRTPVCTNASPAAHVLQPELVATLKGNSESLAMLRDGITFFYSYHLTNGASVAVIPVTPKDCGF